MRWTNVYVDENEAVLINAGNMKEERAHVE